MVLLRLASLLALYLLFFCGTPQIKPVTGDCSLIYHNPITDTTLKSEVKVLEKLEPSEYYMLKSKILKRCSWSGENPDWWFTIIYLESARSFKADTVNHLGYQGAIQLGKSTHRFINRISGMTTPFNRIVSLPLYKQIDYMFWYINYMSVQAAKRGHRLDTFDDIYLAWFYPRAAIENWHSIDKPSVIRANPGFVQKFGRNKGKITRITIKYKLNKFLKELKS